MTEKGNSSAVADEHSQPKAYTNKYLDPDYKGEKLPEELNNGPLENRRCTDCLCCIVFTAFVIAWVAVGIVGFSEGDPTLLTYPIDSSGNQCGLPGGDAEDYKYIYYPFPLIGYLDYRVCVDECPDDWDSEVDCYKNRYFEDCEFRFEDVVGSPHPLFGYIQGIYPADGYVSRFCLPDSDSKGWVVDAYNNVLDEIDTGTIQKWIGDIVTVWLVMLIVAGFAILTGFAYMIFLRICIGVIVWLSIFLTIGIIAILGFYLYWSAIKYYTGDEYEDTRNTLKVCAYVAWGVAALFFFFILYMCNRIRLAIAIMKTGTQFMRDVKTVLLVPPVFFLLTIAIYCYWIVASLFIYSSGEISDDDSSTSFSDIDLDTKTRNMFWFHLFGILWINAFLIALEQFILASTVAIWYFSVGSDAGVQRPISRSVYRAFRYHLGSLAFGSFILAVVWAIKYMLIYIRSYVKAHTGDETSRLVQYLLKCLQCYVNCFERFVKFLNKNAYIQIALHSCNFCAAARDAFFLILRNAGRFAALGSIGAVFLFLGRWTIAIVSTYGGYILITRWGKYEDDIHSPVFPTLVFFCIAYILALLFMSVYSMACDTILHCFLADEELAGTDREATHAPELLKDFINRERTREKQEEAAPQKKKSCCCC